MYYYYKVLLSLELHWGFFKKNLVQIYKEVAEFILKHFTWQMLSKASYMLLYFQALEAWKTKLLYFQNLAPALNAQISAFSDNSQPKSKQNNILILYNIYENKNLKLDPQQQQFSSFGIIPILETYLTYRS